MKLLDLIIKDEGTERLCSAPAPQVSLTRQRVRTLAQALADDAGSEGGPVTTSEIADPSSCGTRFPLLPAPRN
jgi:hypothetical protein